MTMSGFFLILPDNVTHPRNEWRKKGKMTDFAEGELYGTKDHCHGLKVTQHKCQFWGTRMPS
jgi:hypothetical protein